MIELLASIGWGLLAIGAITHVWHHRRLRELLSMHLNNERVPAMALTGAEVVLAVTIPLAWIAGIELLAVLAIAAGILAFGFVAWIARLLLTNSDLPCACSFSSAPTTIWSLARSLVVSLVLLFVATADVGAAGTITTSQALATLATGGALASAIFVLPEAIAWPKPSRALLARVDAFEATPPRSQQTGSQQTGSQQTGSQQA